MHESKDPVRRQRLARLNRRDFLRFGAAGAGLLLAAPSFAKMASARERKLSLHNTHTGETSTTTYWANGRFVTDGLQDLNQLLRDHRSGEVHSIDTDLFDLLYVLQAEVGVRKPYQVISGYRSPKTNEALRQHSSGVAKRSYHMQGMAIDVRLPGCELDRLHQAALSLRSGGVGYYPGSDFIHVDVGPLRSW